jgi:hypothetical protein
MQGYEVIHVGRRSINAFALLTKLINRAKTYGKNARLPFKAQFNG